MTLISNCYLKKEDYDTALDYLFKVWDIIEIQEGIRSESCATICIQISTIYQKKEEVDEAIKFLERAISNF